LPRFFENLQDLPILPFYPQLAGLVPFSPFKHARGVPYVFDSAHFPFWDGRNTDGCDAKKVEGRTPHLPRLWKIAGIRGENCDSGETRMELGASRCVFMQTHDHQCLALHTPP
jgi:hypothetical protein